MVSDPYSMLITSDLCRNYHFNQCIFYATIPDEITITHFKQFITCQIFSILRISTARSSGSNDMTPSKWLWYRLFSNLFQNWNCVCSSYLLVYSTSSSSMTGRGVRLNFKPHKIWNSSRTMWWTVNSQNVIEPAEVHVTEHCSNLRKMASTCETMASYWTQWETNSCTAS